MRTTFLLTALLLTLLFGSLGAQTQLPLPAYSSTYTNAAHTRGFHFQAPAPFTIVAIQVPDEANHGKQNVAVWSSPGKPPTYSATSTAGLRFVSMGQPSSLWLPCHIPFNQNDWVAVLGACGDSTIMHNSYGAGGYVTSLFGGASTLYRLISQVNIVSLHMNNQPIAYSDNGASTIARVMMSVVMSPDLQATGPGTVGSLMSYVLTSPADAGRAYQMGTSLTTGPIPFGSRRLWLGIDKVLEVSVTGLLPATFRNYSGVLNSTGGGAATLAIPNIAQLKGVQFVSAYVTLMPTAPQGISGISGSHVLTVQ